MLLSRSLMNGTVSLILIYVCVFKRLRRKKECGNAYARLINIEREREREEKKKVEILNGKWMEF